MQNCLIEASAGTGKTQALGERLIALLKEGVLPQEIVALTFSRAAAGEIFGRFVGLLAERAETSPDDAQHLRQVLATQHLSQIGTLDSFLMRIVRAFPLELGLLGELTMMDDYEAACARGTVSFSILRRTDTQAKRTFFRAFALAMNHEDVRSFVESYRAFIGTWHRRVAALRDPSAWGDAQTIWGCDPAFAHVTEEHLARAADAIADIRDADAWRAFVDWVRAFRGRMGELKGIAKVVLNSPDLLTCDAFSFSYMRKTYALTPDETRRLQDAIRCVHGYAIRKNLELARGIYTLLSAFEQTYDERVRRAGRLVFDDVPRLLLNLPVENRLALEYRLDAHVRAWALDEFQDTSRGQWAALENLIDEARQSDGEKSVFIVGDTKQAIYGWREGDVGIFAAERENPLYTDKRELKKTYRSGPAVVDAVNRVFAEGRIRTEFPAWRCPKHETAKPDLAGFVRVAEASGRSKEDFVSPVLEAIRANLGLSADDPRRRAVSTAILVRDNKFGAFLTDRLKAAGIEGLVWEGETDVLDTPALAGFLDLVQLADHPGDVVTYRHFGLTALANTLYPDGAPPASALSQEMAQAFAARGLVRLLRELRARLPEDPDVAWSRFTEERFTDMLRAAADFERLQSPGMCLSDFATFLKSRAKRRIADEGKIRVLTIHRSKGLGFDYVILPLYETKSLTAEAKGPLIGPNWILPDPGPLAAKAVGGLADAYRLRKDREEQEALCAYYVALTRAKQAMSIVLSPEGTTVKFSSLVRSAALDDLTNPAFRFGPRDVPTSEKGIAEVCAPVRRPRSRLARRLPSQAFETGVSAGSIFVSSERRERARQQGLAGHAAMERTEFSASLPRPEGFVALWRERAFELLVDGAWVSGRIDRVTFFRDAAGDLCAEIVDFKTSVANPSRYDAQLESYRRAVSVLTHIPPARITARLLAIGTTSPDHAGQNMV